MYALIIVSIWCGAWQITNIFYVLHGFKIEGQSCNSLSLALQTSHFLLPKAAVSKAGRAEQDRTSAWYGLKFPSILVYTRKKEFGSRSVPLLSKQSCSTLHTCCSSGAPSSGGIQQCVLHWKTMAFHLYHIAAGSDCAWKCFPIKRARRTFFFSQSADILLKAVSIRIATVGPFPSVLFVAGLILDALHMDYP